MLCNKFVILIGVVSAVIIFLGAVIFIRPTASFGVTLTPNAYLPYIIKQPTPDTSGLPDLTINYVSITLEDPTCYDGELMGLRAYIDNIGLGDAGTFVVEIEGIAVMVNGLAGGDSTSVWVPANSQKPLAIADATEMVEESNEDNNIFNDLVPIPTLPPPCAFLTQQPKALDQQK